jgi:hypothetical protein
MLPSSSYFETDTPTHHTLQAQEPNMTSYTYYNYAGTQIGTQGNVQNSYASKQEGYAKVLI